MRVHMSLTMSVPVDMCVNESIQICMWACEYMYEYALRSYMNTHEHASMYENVRTSKCVQVCTCVSKYMFI